MNDQSAVFQKRAEHERKVNSGRFDHETMMRPAQPQAGRQDRIIRNPQGGMYRPPTVEVGTYEKVEKSWTGTKLGEVRVYREC